MRSQLGSPNNSPSGVSEATTSREILAPVGMASGDGETSVDAFNAGTILTTKIILLPLVILLVLLVQCAFLLMGLSIVGAKMI